MFLLSMDSTSSEKVKNRKVLRFRGMLTRVVQKLTPKDVEYLAFIYDVDISSFAECIGLKVMDDIVKRELVTNCLSCLKSLKERLEEIGRKDLTHILEDYMQRTELPCDLTESEILPPQVSHPLLIPASTEENQGDITKSTVVPG